MLIVLAAIVALGAGGYYYIKPVRDVAATTNQALAAAKEKGVSDLKVQSSYLIFTRRI
jgi:uncharacterized protein (UPF0333 family)